MDSAYHTLPLPWTVALFSIQSESQPAFSKRRLRMSCTKSVNESNHGLDSKFHYHDDSDSDSDDDDDGENEHNER